MSRAIETAVQAALAKAEKLKLSLEVLATASTSTSISIRQQKVEQFSSSQTHQLGVRVVDGYGEGVAFTESLEPKDLDSVIEEARANAKMIRSEWISELRPGTQLPDLKEIYDPELERVAIEQKMARAAELESSALAVDPAVRVTYTRYADLSSGSWIANTNGLWGHYRSNRCIGMAMCQASDGSATVMDREVESQRRFADLDTTRIGKKAAEKTLNRRGATVPATDRYTVVFDPHASEELFGLIESYFSAKAVDEGVSPLQSKMGQRIFSPVLNLEDNPHYTAAAGSRPFDEEGYPTATVLLVENGVLRSFLTNSVLARKLKLPHTASANRAPSTELGAGASNFVVRPGQESTENLIASAPKVIVVKTFLGSAGFRAASGDFSMPAEGDLYVSGHRAGALKDFLISGNILQLLNSVDAVGKEILSPTGNMVCPALLVRDVNVVGKS